MSIFQLPGVHIPHRKNTAGLVPERMPIPSTVVIPMLMHIGSPAKPIVRVGDTVKVGQLIGEAGPGLSVPVHSGVSGTVKKIDTLRFPSGMSVPTVVIETDGMQTVSEEVCPPVITNYEEFLTAFRNSGLVGLGGAGFPTLVKLGGDIHQIDTILVNGAECEPYITSDTRTMLDDSDRVADGIALLMRYLEVERTVIGIEKNKPQCISAMKQATKDMDGVTVASLPAVYPQGGEKVLIYHALGRTVEEGKLPIDCGVLVINCTTLACLAKYAQTGMPLVEKCVTVDGSAVRTPKNVIAPIGTSISDLIDFCGGFSEPPRKILYGGPMMGIAVADLSTPILKQTNAILAFDAKDAEPPKITSCIQCGRCVEHCPFGLSVLEISKAYKAKDGAMLEKLKVNLCMECGCCSYVCPAKRNNVQRNKQAKAMLREYQNAKKGEQTK